MNKYKFLRKVFWYIPKITYMQFYKADSKILQIYL